MPDDFPILSLITFSPLLGVLVLLFLPKQSGKWIRLTGIAATLVPLALATWLYVDFSTLSGGYQYVEQHSWIHAPLALENGLENQFKTFELRFDYTMAVDGLSLPLVFLTALIGATAALASKFIKKRWKTYYILFLLLEVGMFGVFMAQDLFLFFLFFEATLVPMFFLIGIWGYIHREKAANKFLLYNGLGSALMLIAFLVLIATAGIVQKGDVLYYTGHYGHIMNNLIGENAAQAYVNIADPTNPFYLQHILEWKIKLWDGLSWTIDGKTTVFLLLLIAFGIKLPIFPFHTWMLKVHTEAPPSVVMIHSGILLKMGAYGLIRFGVLLFPQEAKSWAAVLAILGLINIIYGAILAIRQEDFKLVLAYSSISHMGVVLLGIAAFNQAGLQGAVFQMVSHGLISALLFLLVGSIYERTQTTDLRELGGLAKSIPFIGGILMVAGMASLGLPGLSGFAGEFLAFLGIFHSMRTVAVVGTLGIILAAVYVLRGVMGITYGPVPEKFGGLRDARLVEAIPMITLVAFILLLGVYPGILTQTMHQTVVEFDSFFQSIIAAKIGG